MPAPAPPRVPVERIVSGGQTGVDRAALDVALELGLACGGWCPKGRLAEDGCLDASYPLEETPSEEYAERTAWNVRDSDGTLVLNRERLTGGTALTVSLAAQFSKPCLVVELDHHPDATAVHEWMIEHQVRILNVAGPRESKSPGIYRLSRQFLHETLAGVSAPPTGRPGQAQTALITGASAGIGAELATVFAAHGFQVALVARNAKRLHALAKVLQERHGASAHVIASDLAKPGAPETIMAELRRRSVGVDVLVNNAGFGTYGRFAESDLAAELEMVQVNVAALTALTRLCLPGMLAWRHGKILNVASTAAFQPGPLMAVYYATKAYVLSFSEALANELCGTGISVTALCPGPTKSKFQERAGIERTRLLAGRRLMEAREVAEAGYRGLMAGKTVVIPGVRNRLLALATRFAPRGLVIRMVRRLQEERAPRPT